MSSGSPEILHLLGGFALALAAGKAGGALAASVRLPAVAGELLAGLAIAALALAWPAPALLLRTPEVQLLAELGVILLLFEVGLHATPKELLQSSGRAVAVAMVGIVTPLVLGWGFVRLLAPDAPPAAALFVGAALTATSVAVSARVLAEGDSARRKGSMHLVLAAAVLDDILGLVLLTVVLQLAMGGGLTAGAAGWTLLKAFGFLGAALALGMTFSRPLFAFVARLKTERLLLATALVLCFTFAAGAMWAGLAAIVGAFAAGLILEPAHSGAFISRGEPALEDLLHPMSAIFAPIFFVQFGASLDLRALAGWSTLGWGVALTLIAVAGKLVCGLLANRKTTDPWLVGLGMVPRGEVGLVYTAYAVSMPGLLPPAALGGLVIMVLATTLITPPLLALRLRGNPEL